ncbi:MAG: type III secretion system export apparatus subunit SctR [Myxococcaceae bacterium]
MNRSLFLALLSTPALALARTKVATSVADATFAGSPVSMLALLAALSLIPFAIVMLTSFSKIAVVLSITRSAMGTQQAPPTLVLTGLAAVLSAHIMTPTFERMYETAKAQYRNGDSGAALVSTAGRAGEPLKAFLLQHGSAEERARFIEMARELRPESEVGLVNESDLSVVVPAFVITELKEAFQIGFLVFLPFLVLDMLIANILLALGMQSLSPSQVSLPFKLLLFVAVDGWSLLARGLILGYR